MSEAFDIKKLLLSPMTGLYWVKCSMIGLGIGMLLFVGYGLWKAYIKKPDPTTAQRAETINNYYHQPKSTFGCATVKTYDSQWLIQ
jgi:hypothetical protein